MRITERCDCRRNLVDSPISEIIELCEPRRPLDSCLTNRTLYDRAINTGDAIRRRREAEGRPRLISFFDFSVNGMFDVFLVGFIGKVDPTPHTSSFNMGYLVSPYPYPNGAGGPIPVSMVSRFLTLLLFSKFPRAR